MESILCRMKDIEEELINHRRTLHENPELGFELTHTIDYVTKALKSYGYEPEIVGKAGIMATVGPKDHKTFMIRGDMDALPMKEETNLSFASKNNNMHACGHDIHTTALLGAAKILKEREANLKGQVKLMFQPNEERMLGAYDMVDNGLLDEKVDAAMALHVVHAPLGSVGYAKGSACASSDVFKITIQGKGGHGAAPHLNVDPINIACHLNLSLQALNSREVHPDELIVLTICMMHSGTAPNIIPETAVLEGTIRTMNNDVRLFAKKRLVEIADNVAKTFRASCEVKFESQGIPPMINEDALLDDVTRYIDQLCGEGTAYELERMTGSEDFSVISSEVPSVLLWVGTGDETEGYNYGVHDPRVTFSEEAIHKMAAMYAHCAAEWLEEHC